MNSKPPYSLITRLAYLMSFIALAIDGMLPAFPQISSYFGLVSQNEIQKIVFFIFLGMSVGQILFGPLSDAFGRRKVLLLGVSIFIAGSVFCIYAQTFDQLLIGRVIQGFGASSCRIIGVAIIRDLFSGSEMGRIMSFIMIFFILIPAFAPSIGQAVLFFYDWHAIFKLFLIAGVFGFLWVFLKQEETLDLENRNPLTIERFTKGLKDVVSSKEAVGYGLSSGLVFGAMVGYLSCSQLIFAIVFDAEHLFIYIFGGIALFAGLTSYFNASLVRKYKMEKICVAGLILMTGTSGIYLLALNFFEIENNLTVALVRIGNSSHFILSKSAEFPLDLAPI